MALLIAAACSLLPITGWIRQRLLPRGAVGFTLVEIMVVLAIIGILAAAGANMFGGMIRDSETSEVTKTSGHIAQYVYSYSNASYNKTTGRIISEINGYGTYSTSCSSNCLHNLITSLGRPSGGMSFSYEVSATTASADERTSGGAKANALVFCIKATKDTYDVLYSSHGTRATGWRDHINKHDYVSEGDTPATAGGYCNADGTVSSTYDASN